MANVIIIRPISESWDGELYKRALSIPHGPLTLSAHLIDKGFNGSTGLSLGCAEIAPGGGLTLHYHSPDEIYVVTNGEGILNKSGDLEKIKKGDVVYIGGNERHALKNDGKETLEFYWIFPTDRFAEVEYLT